MNSDSDESLSSHNDGPSARKKRYTFKSYQESLKSVHLPSATTTTTLDNEIGDIDSHFHTSIEHWKQLNLAPSFLKYAGKVKRMSASMPLLLLNWEEIVGLWVETVSDCEEDALRPLLDMLQNLAHDLRTTLIPQYSTLLSTTTSLLSRTLAPETLTTLLSTLSSLFRYILSSTPKLLSLSFNVIRSAMVTSRAKVGGGVAGEELQRMIAEVWGSVLRRVKTASRKEAVQLLADGLDGCEEGIAWCLIYATKAPSQSIHPSTPLLLRPLLDIYLSSESEDQMFILFRRLLTSLIHHTSDPQGFTPVSNILVEIYQDEIRNITSSSHGQRRVESLWRLLAVIFSVRKGSRMNQKQIMSVLSLTNSEDVSFCDRSSLDRDTHFLTFVVSVLNASETVAWMGNGRKLIDRIWETDKFLGIRLAGGLTLVDWTGWKAVILPQVLRNTLSLLDSATHSSQTLRHLALFCERERLNDVDASFRQKLEDWMFRKLDTEKWEGGNVEDILDLESIEKLIRLSTSGSSRLVQAAIRLLQTRVNVIVNRDAAIKDYVSRPGNDSWIVATCLRIIASGWSNMGESHRTIELDDAEQLCRRLVEMWGWNSLVLAGVVQFVEARFSSSPPVSLVPFADAFASLESSLMSPYQDQRIATLRFLNSPLVEHSKSQQDVIQRLLVAEHLPLDMTGAKERQLKISRAGLGITDETEFKFVLVWLVAQLKVNIKPLWASAAKAIAILSGQGGTRAEVIWDIIFRELNRAAERVESELGVYSPEWAIDQIDDGAEEEKEKEKTWRCPSRLSVEKSVEKVPEMGAPSQLKSVIKMQAPPSRLDHVNYEAQLVVTIGENPSWTEKHNRILVPFFLRINSPLLPRIRLKNYLVLFSKFSNPKSIHQTDLLRKLYLQLLSSPDRPLQILALDCLLTYRSPSLTPHEENFRRILDDVKWRDEITSFNFDAVSEEHREELMDVISRILFGIMGEKKGRSGRSPDRRAAALTLLGRSRTDELRFLVDLMLEPFGGLEQMTSNEETKFEYPAIGNASEKQFIGYLTLLGDLMKNLGERTLKYWPALLGTTMGILGHGQHRLMVVEEPDLGSEPERDEEDNAEIEAGEHQVQSGTTRSTKGARHARQLGLRRFSDFFRIPSSFSFSPYMPTAFSSFISPRLSDFARENSQSPTALLELFVIWARNPEVTHFLDCYDSRLLPSVYNCLAISTVKDPVIAKIFDIAEQLLLIQDSEDHAAIKAIVEAHVDHLVDNLAALVENTNAGRPPLPEALLQRMTGIMSSVAPHIRDESQAAKLLNLLSPQIEKPFRIVPDRIKADLLKIVQNIIPLVPALQDSTNSLHVTTYQMLSSTFLSVRNRQARVNNASAFEQLAVIDNRLSIVAGLLTSLNSFSATRSELPDFGRRLAAFAELNETLHSVLDLRQWLPLIYNMLFYLQDAEELSIRTNASLSLRRFINLVPSAEDTMFETTFKRILYPELRKLLRSKVELVRSEVIGIIAHAVQKCTSIAFLRDMQPLLMGGDEEANFFNNIYHIQVHRRVRALRRLGEICQKESLCHSTLNDVLVPIAEQFIGTSTSANHTLVDEAIKTMGFIAGQLAWGPYNALFRKYMRLVKEKSDAERVYMRTIVSILTHFHFAIDAFENGMEEEKESQLLDSPLEVEAELKLNLAVAHNSKIADAVNARMLPTLLEYLENRHNSDDSARIPIAIGIVHVALHLPQEQRKAQIFRLITILSQILRSKAQDTRDLAKDTLTKIMVTLGHKYLEHVVSELQQALTRGPQLHILAFVVHGILVQLTESTQKDFNLDDSAASIAHVAAEVVFGQSGRDLLSEDFRTSAREVRGSSSRGLDTFGILARYITPSKVSAILEPCRAILHETEALKVMTSVDDVLRRIATGLNSNELISPSDLLILCHTLISQNARFLSEVVPKKRKGRVHSDIQVDLKVKRVAETQHYANNSYRFICLGLDLLVTAFKRSRFDLSDTQVVARLNPLVPLIGNSLYSSNASVVGLALKATSAVAKCPLPVIPKSLPVFVRQILTIIRQGGSTGSEVVQTAFKTLAVIIRDASGSEVKESDLTYLIELLTPDLEEPDRQAAVFTLLRAIIARKFVIPEIYDLMENVSAVMVTSQSPHVQEQCRAVFLQFLLDYPQGKGRLRNHMTFLAKNLSYTFDSGRKSVMELLGAIFAKFNLDLLREFSDLFFVSLVMSIANDDSIKCREMGAELLKSLFGRLDDTQTKAMISHLHAWATQDQRPQLSRVAIQTYGLFTDALQDQTRPYLSTMLDDVNQAIERSAKELLESEMDIIGDEEPMDWQLPYQAMTTLGKLLQIFHDLRIQTSKVSWHSIYSLMVFPHAWVRFASTRLQGTLFSSVPISTPDPRIPPSHPTSLQSLVSSVKKMSIQLKSESLDSGLGLQIVKNLFYIGKTFALVPVASAVEEMDSDGPQIAGAGKEKEDGATANPLAWILSKISNQARVAYISRRSSSSPSENWFIQPSSILKWLAAMVTHLDQATVERFLNHLLIPTYRIIEDDTVKESHMEELKILAQELQDLVQAKVGTTKFANAYNDIRQKVLSVRTERKTVRVMQANANPDIAAKRKIQKNISKRDGRKRKMKQQMHGRETKKMRNF